MSTDTFDEKYEQVIDQIPRYGGIGYVVKAFNITSNEEVAIKVVPFRDIQSRISFQREVKVLQRLPHHGVVRIIDYGISDTRGFIVLPWFEYNLNEYLARFAIKSFIEYSQKIVMPILSTMAFMHETSQIAHRDLKPSNILIDASGKPKIADFGISKIIGLPDQPETVGEWNSGIYTPEFSGSPFELDVYSLGALIIESFSGSRSKSRAEMALKLENLEMPRDVKEMLYKCIEVDPVDRFRSAIDLNTAWQKHKQKYMANVNAENALSWIRLTKTAYENLGEFGSTEDEILEKLTLHLNQSLLHCLSRLTDEGNLATNEFWLISDYCRILLVENEEQSGWVVKRAAIENVEQIDVRRRAGIVINQLGILWLAARKPSNQGFATVGFNKISKYLNQWIDLGAPGEEASRLQSTSDADLYLETLSKSLDAMEEYERGKVQPLFFENLENDGKAIQITLTEPVTFSLLETTWSIPASKPILAQVIYQSESGKELILLTRIEPRVTFPKHGQITPDLDGGWKKSAERQKHALTQVIDETCVQPKLGSFIASPELIPIGSKVSPSKWLSPTKLDVAKENAVAISLGAPFLTIVQGPPGTGKTSFIAELVAQEISRNVHSRILLVSQTHVALDNALEKIHHMGISEIARLGRIEDPKVSAFSRDFLIENQMQKWALELEERSNLFAEKAAREAGFSLVHARSLTLLSKLKSLVQTRELALEEIELTSKTNRNKTEITASESEEIAVADFQESDDEIQKILSILHDSLGKEFGVKKSISISEIEKFITKLQGQINITPAFKSMIETQAEWLARVSSSKQLAPLFLRSRNVLAGTCIGFLGHPAVKDLRFDLCILDEASKATATQALVSMSMSEKWVLVGDSNQLSAKDFNMQNEVEILKNNQITLEEYNETMFERLEKGIAKDNLVTLDCQYRMVDPIAAMISTLFYEGNLKSKGPAHNSELRKSGYPPLLWLDTSHLDDDSGREYLAGKSFSNRKELLIIKKEIEKLLKSEIAGEFIDTERLHVMVIAAYASQVEQAFSLLDGLTSGSKKIYLEISTIDAVQGREADIVFFSTVRNNKHGSVGFLKREDWQRINVSLSRARQSVVIIGDLDFWKNADSALDKVVEYFENNSDCEIRESSDV